jgi:hypothetical protein
MSWLFVQVWFLLLIAFALGSAAAFLLHRTIASRSTR